MSPRGTIPSLLLCVVRRLVPAVAAGDGPRARLGEAEDVARDRLRVLQAQCVRALRASEGRAYGKAIFACRFSESSSECNRGRGEEAAGIKRSASSLLGPLLDMMQQE